MTNNSYIVNGSWASSIANSTRVDLQNMKIDEELDKLKLSNILLKLKILKLEGTFSQDEVTNLRKMIMSEDTASKELALTIIENA